MPYTSLQLQVTNYEHVKFYDVNSRGNATVDFYSLSAGSESTSFVAGQDFELSVRAPEGFGFLYTPFLGDFFGGDRSRIEIVISSDGFATSPGEFITLANTFNVELRGAGGNFFSPSAETDAVGARYSAPESVLFLYNLYSDPAIFSEIRITGTALADVSYTSTFTNESNYLRAFAGNVGLSDPALLTLVPIPEMANCGIVFGGIALLLCGFRRCKTLR